MWRQLLAASDDSLAGLHAVRVAEVLARTVGARLSVVTVLRSPGDHVPAGLARYRPVVSYGHTGIEIVRTADRLGADLVVLGRTTRGDPCSPRLGPTADAVIRRSDRPCLVIPLGQDHFDHTVVALDGTHRGLSVLDCALEFVRTGGGELEAVLVEPGVHRGKEEPHSTKRLRIQEALGRVRDQNGHPWRLRVLRGEPGAILGAELRDSEADVLVVGARRGGPAGTPDSTGVGRTLLYTAPCAVLTVPL